MDSHALRVLEFDRVLEALARQAATELGRDLALALAPALTLPEAERRQTETAEARRLVDDFGGIPLGGIHNLLPHLEKAIMAAGLSGHELLDVADTLGATERLRKFLKKQTASAPGLAATADGLIPIPSLVDTIRRSIDDAGEVRDGASEKLARIRRDIRTTTGRIQEKLNSIISSSGTRTALQDPVVVTRHGRWCVPVRSEHRSSVPGIVHDASASGATIFVEPQAVVEMGNRLREQEAIEKEEVDRILRELATRVAGYADEIHSTMGALAQIDLASARALLAEEQNATRPALKDGAFFKFTKARHPLLKGDVVPIDVRLGTEFRVLLITGPNTGGKTVSLKTAGLLVLMAQSGLQVPAESGSCCGMFRDIFADIGDEQSIEQSLSTFSGHVRNIVNTLRDVKPRSLVLFDELGAGTDPAEGAALASAVLRWLSTQNVCVMATTHYGELKSFAFATEGFENASVEFDPETLRPTYRLLIGVPGASHALHIAERLGMPRDVLDIARDEMKNEGSSAEELIRQVEESRLKAVQEQTEAERIRREAENLRKNYERDLSSLEAERGQAKEQVQSQARKVIRDTEAELEKLLRELRTQKRHSAHTEGLAGKAKRLLTKLDDAAEKAEVQVAKKTQKKTKAPAPEEPEQKRPLKKGDQVRMIGVGTLGTLLEDPVGDEVVVQFGSIEARLAASRVEPVSAPPPQPSRGTHVSSLEMTRAATVSPEIMLRGQRVEEALARLDRYLDDACLAGLERVRVIHGKGTGVMRKAVWEFMRKHPSVESLALADAEEGGDGATIVRLR